MYLYGADITVNYTYEGYDITATSNSNTVTVSPSTQSVGAGGDAVVMFNNVSDPSTILVKDNGVDVTNQLGQEYPQGTANKIPNAVVENTFQADNTYPATNGLNGTESTTYARLNLSPTERYIIYSFDTSEIPNDVSILSVDCQVHAYVTSTSTNITTKSAQLYAGTTAKGSTTTIPTSDSTWAISNVGTWTASEIHDIRIRLDGYYGGSSTYYIRFYGANLTVTYRSNNIVYTYTISNVQADHVVTVEDKAAGYQINASSTYAGATIVATPTSVQEGGNCVLTLTTSDISKVSVVDNGSDITSQFTGSNGTFTYTLTNVITAHTIVVSEVAKKLYMKIDGVMKSVSRIHMKTNNVWTSISFVDFWRKVNGVYINGEAVSGTTFLMYGGEMENIPEIGTVNKTSSDLTITINDNALESGTYKMFYEDSNRTPLERVDEITEFTIS